MSRIIADIQKEVFAERLKTACQIRGITQGELGKRAGIPKPSMSGYYNGVYFPGEDKAMLFAEILQVNIDWLMGKLEAPFDQGTTPTHSTRYYLFGKSLGEWNIILTNESKKYADDRDALKEIFSRQMREAVASAYGTQKALVQALAIDGETSIAKKETVGKYCRGFYIPSPTNHLAIAKGLGVHPLWLFGQTDYTLTMDDLRECKGYLAVCDHAPIFDDEEPEIEACIVESPETAGFEEFITPALEEEPADFAVMLDTAEPADVICEPDAELLAEEASPCVRFAKFTHYMRSLWDRIHTRLLHRQRVTIG